MQGLPQGKPLARKRNTEAAEVFGKADNVLV